MMAELTPAAKMAEVYATEYSPRSFEEDVELHYRNGLVFDMPDFFVMGRPVNHLAAPDLIVDSAVVFPPEDWDCWMVKGLSGSLRKAWGVLPFDLPYMALERMNNLRIYHLDRLRRLSR